MNVNMKTMKAVEERAKEIQSNYEKDMKALGEAYAKEWASWAEWSKEA